MGYIGRKMLQHKEMYGYAMLKVMIEESAAVMGNS